MSLCICAAIDNIIVISVEDQLLGVSLDGGEEPMLPPITELGIASAIDYHAGLSLALRLPLYTAFAS